MKTWPVVIFLVAVAVIGCAGSGTNMSGTSGGGVTTTTSAGGTTGRAQSAVNIPNKPGVIDVNLLGGQGRAPTYVQATIGHIDFSNPSGLSTFPDNALPGDLNMQLDAYSDQNRVVNAPVPSSLPSIDFTDMQITFKGFALGMPAGPINFAGFVFDTSSPQNTSLNQMVDVNSFQGRTEAMQVYLNDGMFTFDQLSDTASLDTTQFLAQNADPASGKILGFFSDYLAFDITHVANKPSLVNAAGFAQRVYASGDNFALSQAMPAIGGSAEFEVLTPYGTYPGVFHNVDPIVNLKEYTLQQVDPRLQFPPRMITALEGVYYDYTERVNTSDATFMLTFPKRDDGPRQDVVVVTRSGGNITNLWFGTVNFGAAGGPTFTTFPISDIQPAQTAGQSSGRISNLVDANGNPVSEAGSNWWQTVHAGTFSVTSGGGGIPVSGRMFVYRI